MNNKITVKYKYLYANDFKTVLTKNELLNAYERVREQRLEVWMDNDGYYDPTRVFTITKMNFDKNGNATYIVFNEEGMRDSND